MKDLEDYLDQFLEEEDTPHLKIPVTWSSPLDIEITPREIGITPQKEKDPLKSTEVNLAPKKRNRGIPLC